MRLFILFLVLVGTVHSDGIETQPLEAWLSRQANIRTLQTEFIQERTLAALKRPVTTPGKMTLTKNGQMRWDLGSPVKTTAISDGT
ncbi:MAG: outer membrane lipoprotein carrier protein LolA, partial [Verrucomicrobiales bacterium]